MKIASVVGARPQFIKAALVSKELRKKHTEILIHTGQHYDREMSNVFFTSLNIPKPDYNLGVGSGGPGEQVGKMIIAVEEVLLKEEPDAVLVYGDTNSTLAGTLAAVKMNIPVAHVEAGLRSYNRKMPEEINRVIVDHISNILFCPTKTAVRNLGKEGIRKNVHLVGDVMYDIALVMRKTAEKSRIIKKLGMDENGYLLATIHRPSNTDSRKNLSSIVSAIINCGEKIVFPVHPRTAKCLRKYGLYNTLQRSGNVIVTPPLGYVDFQNLLIHSKKVLTDSGGVQKEAYFFTRPGIILREDTEWVEIVKDGWNVLVGANTKKIIDAINRFEPKSRHMAVFGDGNTAGKIVEILARCYKKTNKPQRDTKNPI